MHVVSICLRLCQHVAVIGMGLWRASLGFSDAQHSTGSFSWTLLIVTMVDLLPESAETGASWPIVMA
jgi:hypothetical protein